MTQAQQQDSSSSKICLDTADFIRIANDMRVLRAQNEYLKEELAVAQIDNEIKDEIIYYCEKDRKKDRTKGFAVGVGVAIIIKGILFFIKK